METSAPALQRVLAGPERERCTDVLLLADESAQPVRSYINDGVTFDVSKKTMASLSVCPPRFIPALNRSFSFFIVPARRCTTGPLG